jgi:uncharacterized damage-inducible protein DinB
MDPRIVALSHILRLNTRLFRNCLDGVSDEQVHARPSASTNSLAFVAAHLVDSRFFVLRTLGVELANPLSPLLANVRGIDELTARIPLDTLADGWTTASHALRDRLEAITGAELDATFETRLPGPEQTVLGTLTFLAQHDSYHVGQLALLRKYVGLPAMTYG